MKRLFPWIALLVVLVSVFFLSHESRRYGTASGTKAALGSVSSHPLDMGGREIQERAAGHAIPMHTASADVRNNWLLESKYIVAGSLEGGAIAKALDSENFEATLSSFAAASRGNPELVARNEKMLGTLADALSQVDDGATLREFTCSRHLCVAEVRAGADRQSIDYTGFLTDELEREKLGIHVQVSSNEQVGDMTSFRTFFSMEPAIRSIRAPSQ